MIKPSKQTEVFQIAVTMCLSCCYRLSMQHAEHLTSTAGGPSVHSQCCCWHSGRVCYGACCKDEAVEDISKCASRIFLASCFAYNTWHYLHESAILTVILAYHSWHCHIVPHIRITHIRSYISMFVRASLWTSSAPACSGAHCMEHLG